MFTNLGNALSGLPTQQSEMIEIISFIGVSIASFALYLDNLAYVYGKKIL